jgi:hypothetical protein
MEMTSKNVSNLQILIREKAAVILSAALVIFGFITIFLQVDNQFTVLFLLFEGGLLILSAALPFFLKLLWTSFSSLSDILSKFTDFSEEDSKKYRVSGGVALFILIVGGVLSAGGVLTISTLGLPWNSTARTFFQIWLYLILFGYGVVAGLYMFHVRLLFSMSKMNVSCSPFYWPRIEISYLYRFYSKLLAAGTILYVLAIVSFWSTPGNWLVNAWLTNTTFSAAAELGAHLSVDLPWRLIESLWVFPVAICIIFFFVLFNYGCHEFLTQCQSRSIDYFSKLASKVLEDWEKKPTIEKREKIDKLLEWRDKIKKERVWPLDFLAILSIIATTIVPIIQTFINFA